MIGMNGEPAAASPEDAESRAGDGGRWQAPLALLLGVMLTTLPGAPFSSVLFWHMQRPALPVSSIALFHPPYPIGLLLASLPAAALVGRLGPGRTFLASAPLVTSLSLAAALPLDPWALIGLRLLRGMASAGLPVAAGALGGLLAPFLTLLVFLLGGTIGDGSASALANELGPAALLALLAAWLSVRVGVPIGEATR